MNQVVAEMRAILEGGDELIHYGMPRRSGRYPWGSGKDPYQHSIDFLGRVEELKKNGWKETPKNIMEEFGLTTGEYRTEKRICKNERRMHDVATAKTLKGDGLGYTEIGRKMGISESSVRSLLSEQSNVNMLRGKNTADFIKSQIDSKGMIDVGAGVEHELRISKETLDEALYILKREGYEIHGGRVDQATNAGQKTTIKVICPPGTKASEVYNNPGEIHSMKEYTSHDSGETYKTFRYPESMDSNRLAIRYKEDGGIDRDGIVEIRRGVPDLSLGEGKRYSQVRILVDGTHYIKGMAVYSDDLPDGIDVMFNTNKSNTVAKMDVLKKIKNDPDNPFGSLISPKGQSEWTDADGNKHLSLINKRADEGDWTEWKDALPSQFLSKQSKALAQQQLNLAASDKYAEFEEICSIPNPTLKKHLLQKFSDECDSAAVNLQAAALPGQKYHVIIPVNALKDNEVYAPNYESGTKLALIRYPHAGIFEIPILTVNNKNPDAKKLIGEKSIDAVGITKNVADRLSGADFDGDTVMCIPTHDRFGKVKIASSPQLKGLVGFDTKDAYQYDDTKVDSDGTTHYYRNGKEFRIMKNTQIQMGEASNLITDMTLKGASPDELAAAVRHSMVVIDAEKHKLDYKQSEIDNNIAGLKKLYQSYTDEDGTEHSGGPTTLISRSKGEKSVDKRQGSPIVNLPGAKMRVKVDGEYKTIDVYDSTRPEGALIYKTADDLEYTKAKIDRRSNEAPNSTVRVSSKGKTYIQFDGDDNWTMVDGKVNLPDGTRVRSNKHTVNRQQQSTRMAETDDARTLISDFDTPMERLYADHANKMKALANQARKEIVTTGNLKQSTSAKKTYAKEVADLNEKVKAAELNRPRERMAQLKTKAEIKAKTDAYEMEYGQKMKPADRKKLSQQTLSKYRTSVGSIARRDRNIDITDREWEAIQAGAISDNALKKILNNTDIATLRERATPRSTTSLRPGQVNRIKAMSASNYSLEQIAKALGVSTSTVHKYMKGGK